MIDLSSPRPAVRWSTHSAWIMLFVALAVGGTSFGVALAFWPVNAFERILGSAILVGVVSAHLWLVTYLLRPVHRA